MKKKEDQNLSVILYNENFETQLIEFINITDDNNEIHLFDNTLNENVEYFNLITLLTTENFINYSRFEEKYKSLKELGKKILPVLIGNLNEESKFDNYLVTKLVKPLQSELNIEAFKNFSFRIFINHFLFQYIFCP